MTEALITGIVAPLLAYALDRFRYGKQIKKAATVLAPTIPNATARKIAEQAVIAANQREIEKAVEHMQREQAAHKHRLALIERGGVNFGDLHKDTSKED
jgi:hypothetical protein